MLTNRGVAAVGSPIHSVRIRQFDHDPDGAAPQPRHHRARAGCRWRRTSPRTTSSSTARCRTPAAPLIYLQTEDLAAFRPRQPDRRRLVRRGHGLRAGPGPTTFDEPMFDGRRPRPLLRRRPQPVVPVELGDLGEREALIPFLRPVLEGGARGTRTRRSAGRSRSATAASSTRRSWPSRDAARRRRTPSTLAEEPTQTSSTAVGAPATDQVTPAASTCRATPPAPRMTAAPGQPVPVGDAVLEADAELRPAAIAIASMVPEPSIRTVAARAGHPPERRGDLARVARG